MSKRKKSILTIIILLLFVMLLMGGGYLYCLYEYPLKFEAQIAAYAKEFSVDPYLIATIIWAESHYQEDVVSDKGAVGLMQIMPDTGKWIANKLGIEDYDPKMLYSADFNIRFGCWYISYLENKFDGDMIKILAGYNAGPNKVLQWEEEWGKDYSPIWKDIPYAETKNYVKKIQSAQNFYKFLYSIH